MSRRRRRHHKPQELNIIAFLNIMVILIPFLLVSTVFSRTNILELNIPPAGPSLPLNELQNDMQLVITVRKDSIDVGDTVGGLLKRIPKTAQGHDFRALSQLLTQVKARFPDKKNATILPEPQVSYEILVRVMDAVRSVEQVQSASLVRAELFPEISIGDAPLAE